MTGFSIDWLDLREAADRRARDDALLDQARQWLQTDMKRAAGRVVVDLGAGTGSTLRAFSPSSASSAQLADQESIAWRLVDRDAALLAEASRRHGGSHSLQTYEADLTDIAGLPFEGAQLITASALFDLVSADFIDSLAGALHDRCQRSAVGLYAALSYNGLTSWSPVHPLDDTVLDAFNRDQRTDKGFGVSLGPDAAPYMEKVFKKLGFKVLTADSPWTLDGSESKLVEALIGGIGEAVAKDPALDTGRLQDWIEFRKAHAASGTCSVGHSDLLALPRVI